MVVILKVDKIQKPNSDSDMIVFPTTVGGETTVTGLGEHVLQTVHYEHYETVTGANNTYYYWGQSGVYDVSITTRKNNSYIYFNTRIFGEPSGHNAYGRFLMAPDDGDYALIKTVTAGQNGHLKLAPYEYTGDYNSTPYQNTFHSVIDTCAYSAGTKLSFRMIILGNQTMRFNSAYNSGILYETAPSSLTLQELNNANTAIYRVGDNVGSY